MKTCASPELVEQLRTNIGCSELAAVMGLSKWKTPYQVWAQKTGRAAPLDISDQLRIRLGHMFEDDLAEIYTWRTGFKLRMRSEAKPYRHPTLPLIGHPDREIVGLR